jgi:hypothetical protein
MGREVRRVPPNWQHPESEDRYGRKRLQPMFDDHIGKRFAEWLADFDRIRRDDLKDIERECYPLGLADWLQDEGRPPDPAYYRPWKDEEATWFQVWETVSEGTPVTPPFATKAELVDYLVANGDFWDQKRRAEGDSIMNCAPWQRASAEQFVNTGWAPTFIVQNTPGKPPAIHEPRDGALPAA